MNTTKRVVLSLGAFSLLCALCSNGDEYKLTNAEELFTYSREVVYPVDVSNPPLIKGSVIYNGNETLEDISIYARFLIDYEGSPYWYGSSYVSSIYPYINKGDIIDYSFEILDIETYFENNIQVEITVRKFQTSINYDKRTINILPKLNSDIDIDLYHHEPLEISRITRLDGSFYPESFLFDNIYSELTLPYYYRLDPSILSFSYISEEEFHIAQLFISFFDIYHLFPYLKENDEGEKILDMEYVIEEDRVSLRFSKLYVNPDSLESSSTQKEDYLATRYLYLPRNSQLKLNDYVFTLHLIDMGMNGINVHQDLGFEIDSLFLGDCELSLYCIVGGIKE